MPPRQSVQEDVGFLGPLFTAWSILGALAESLGGVLFCAPTLFGSCPVFHLAPSVLDISLLSPLVFPR